MNEHKSLICWNGLWFISSSRNSLKWLSNKNSFLILTKIYSFVFTKMKIWKTFPPDWHASIEIYKNKHQLKENMSAGSFQHKQNTDHLALIRDFSSRFRFSQQYIYIFFSFEKQYNGEIMWKKVRCPVEVCNGFVIMIHMFCLFIQSEIKRLAMRGVQTINKRQMTSNK